MSTLAFWLLMLLAVAFVAAVIGVGLAVRSLLKRAHGMTAEVGQLSRDISDVVGSVERG